MTARHLTTTRVGRALVTLVALALLAVTLHSVKSSGASYVGASANPGSVITSGSLSHDNSAPLPRLVLAATDLRPGGPATVGSLAITGGGTLSGVYAVRAQTIADTAGPGAATTTPGLSTALHLTIDDGSGTTTFYAGTLAGLATTPGVLGGIAPNETRTYRFLLSYPSSSADPGLQGASTRVVLDISGASS